MVRHSETYSIELVHSDRGIIDRLKRVPEILPKATDITTFDVMRDLECVFREMADSLGNMQIVRKRQIHYWCCRCNAYIGCKEIPLVVESFRIPDAGIMTNTHRTVNTEHYLCDACGEQTSFTVQDKVFTTY